tara:strand:+ start:39156 stop:39518 length:363 start_codon:yes stop_codon:yes gene_type:complete
MLFVVGNVCSQNQGTITGTVSDVELDNEPLLFANVQLKNTSKIAQTNFHGNFEFTNIESGEYILVFSFLGYDTIEVPVVVKNNEIIRVNGGLKTKVILLETSLTADVAAVEKSKNSISLK